MYESLFITYFAPVWRMTQAVILPSTSNFFVKIAALCSNMPNQVRNITHKVYVFCPDNYSNGFLRKQTFFRGVTARL